MEPWEFRIILIIVGLNILLSGLHKLLEYIKDKTETKIDDKLFVVITFLLTSIEWLMANRKKCK